MYNLEPINKILKFSTTKIDIPVEDQFHLFDFAFTK